MAEKKSEAQVPVNIPTTDMEKWEIAEIVDEAITMGARSEYMKNEYMYEFRQGGEIVRDLTTSMYKHLALVEGIRINKDETQFDESDDWVDCRVLAQFTHPVTGEVHDAEGFGSRAIPDKTSPKYEQVRKFIRQTVYSIAVRNAIKQLLPFDVVVGAINALAEGTKDGTVPTAKYKQEGGRHKERKTPRERNKSNAFAQFQKREAALIALGVDFNAFWYGVSEHFGVKSSDDISAEQWKDLADDLRSKDGEITQSIIDKITGVESESVDVEGEPTEDEALSDSGVTEQAVQEETQAEDEEDGIPF